MRASRGMGAVREDKRPVGFASGGVGNWIKGAVRKKTPGQPGKFGKPLPVKSFK